MVQHSCVTVALAEYAQAGLSQDIDAQHAFKWQYNRDVK